MNEDQVCSLVEDKVTYEIKRVSRQLMLVEMYKWKRAFCALDEWLSYGLLLLLFAYQWYYTLAIVLPLVCCGLITSYLNLDEIEEEMGYIRGVYTFWPFCYKYFAAPPPNVGIYTVE